MKTEDKQFYKTLFRLVGPIAVQYLINTAVSSADVVMLGYVSQTALAAGSLANQIQFILNLFLAGVTSGMTILAAQYWGKRDLDSIQKILGIGLKISASVTFCFSLAAWGVPQYLMRIFTNDENMIANGVIYLRTVGISYFLMGISQVYLCIMKSMERVRVTTAISGSALILNIILNASFIFGWFGLPKLGIMGVALATSIARAIELALCAADWRIQKVIALRLKKIFRKDSVLFRDFLRFSMPAMGNEVVWGVAFAMYSVVMGHLGEDMVAANSVVSVARNLGTVVCMGVANGGGILLGKEMGQNRLDQARRDARRISWVTFAASILGGIIIFFLRPVFLQMGNLSPLAREYLSFMILVNAVYIIGQGVNTCWICGVFRAGGDSRYGFLMDLIIMWGYAVPAGFLCAFVLHFPPMLVYVVLCTDEFVKMPFIMARYKKYKWLKNITRESAAEGAAAK